MVITGPGLDHLLLVARPASTGPGLDHLGVFPRLASTGPGLDHVALIPYLTATGPGLDHVMLASFAQLLESEQVTRYFYAGEHPTFAEMDALGPSGAWGFFLKPPQPRSHVVATVFIVFRVTDRGDEGDFVATTLDV